MTKLFILVALFFNYNFSPLSEYEINAKNFGFQGVQIGASFKQVKTKFPKMKENEENNSYTIKMKDGPVQAATFRFWDGKLFSIALAYTSENLEKGGVMDKLKEKILTTFGPPHSQEEGNSIRSTFSWSFSNVNRNIKVDIFQKPLGVVGITVTDAILEQKFKEKEKSKVDVGF
jgi:predicted GNAT family acetyltransferase